MKDYELAELSEERLIAYVVSARRAGRSGAAQLGLGIFAQRRWDDLVRRALLKMPNRSDAEDVAGQTIRDVFKAAFDGMVIGEAVSFINTILARRIADFHKARKQTEALPEDLDDEEGKGRDLAIADDDTVLVDTQDTVDRLHERLSPEHKQVVDDYVFKGYDANETAARVNTSFPDLDPPMSAQNVHQIASRFRKDLREALEQS